MTVVGGKQLAGLLKTTYHLSAMYVCTFDYLCIFACAFLLSWLRVYSDRTCTYSIFVIHSLISTLFYHSKAGKYLNTGRCLHVVRTYM